LLVDCIDIDVIKSPTEIKKASDGSSIRLYAGKFEIDMAKCMFCGLCTTVCPTECLTMTKTYDFSEFDVDNLAYEFSNLTKTESEKKEQEYIDFMEAKKAAKLASNAVVKPSTLGVTVPGVREKVGMPAIKKPAIPGGKKFSPVIKSKSATSATPSNEKEVTSDSEGLKDSVDSKRSVPGVKKFNPPMKSKSSTTDTSSNDEKVTDDQN